MKNLMALKLDRRTTLSLTIATTIAFSYQVNFAVARLDEDAAAKINTMLDRANTNINNNNSTTSSRNDSNTKTSSSKRDRSRWSTYVEA
jgi:hypothetical protein